VTITGQGMVVRYQGLWQNHNIRRDLIPREFGKWRAYIIGCNCFSSFRGAVHKEGIKRTAPLRPRIT